MDVAPMDHGVRVVASGGDGDEQLTQLGRNSASGTNKNFPLDVRFFLWSALNLACFFFLVLRWTYFN